MIHPLVPIFDEHSNLLILGTFPSVKSREANFYYANPQNRFWKVLGAIVKEESPKTDDEKRRMLLKHRIALWDVVYSCDIVGSSDSSIQNVIPNDIRGLIAKTSITKLYANGARAMELYQKHCESEIGLPIALLPSTSPANASMTLPRLIKRWEEVLKIENKKE
ncbi:MAG: DNA-deoxyinosine glycosylase [Erysipelotrichaceae bacterium]